MSARSFVSLVVIGLAMCPAPAFAQDAETCFAMADRIATGVTVEDDTKRAAHEACLRAFATSSNVVQKYHLQEADDDITGTRPKN
jgi:hypothetical protein